MKFTENFKTHIVPSGQRYGELHYIDSEVHETPTWTGEGEAPFPEISMKIKKLVVKLESKTITGSLSRELILDLDRLGIDAINQTKTAILNEWEVNHEKELFQTAFDVAITKYPTRPVNRIIGWINRKIGFRPKIHASSPLFLSQIQMSRSSILQSSRIGGGNWIVVSPKASIVFDENPSFVYERDNNIKSNQINFMGTLNGLRVYVSWLIKDNWVLIGRSYNSDHDKTIFTATSEDEWLGVETMEHPSMTPITNIGLRKQYKTQCVPGGETNYIKWEFSFNEETLWGWIKFKIKKLIGLRKKS